MQTENILFDYLSILKLHQDKKKIDIAAQKKGLKPNTGHLLTKAIFDLLTAATFS